MDFLELVAQGWETTSDFYSESNIWYVLQRAHICMCIYECMHVPMYLCVGMDVGMDAGMHAGMYTCAHDVLSRMKTGTVHVPHQCRLLLVSMTV